MDTVWPSVRLNLMRTKGLLTGHLDVSSVFLVDCFHLFEPLDFHFKGLDFLKEYMFADFLEKEIIKQNLAYRLDWDPLKVFGQLNSFVIRKIKGSAHKKWLFAHFYSCSRINPLNQVSRWRQLRFTL
jgi:hypothetical protein